jgi:TonB-like protein
LWLLNLLFVLCQVPSVFEPPHLTQFAPVGHNPNIVASTWVIGNLDIGADGAVKAATALRDAPLPGTVFSSVSRWRFTPGYATTPVESQVAAVFLFRPRDIYSSAAPDLTGISVAGLNRPPIPISLSDPGYLATSIAEGEVILELSLSETGAIQNVRVISGVAGLGEFTEQAVRSWRFASALWNGMPVPGTVIAVVSYLRPVL